MRLKFNAGTCSGCKACELICTLQNFKVINPSKAMLKVRGEFPEPGIFSVDVCDQCGACAAVCPNQAIVRKGSIYSILEEKCDQCMACLDACLTNLIKINDKGYPYKCLNCRQCVNICPRDALTFELDGRQQ